jgi:hypothetical protein
MGRTFTSSTGTVTVDEQYLPVLLTKWQGRLQPDITRQYMEWMNEQLGLAKARGSVIVQVSEALQAERPDAVTRKLLAEMTDSQRENFPEVLLDPSFVVIDSPVLRGVITALGWITRGGLDVRTYATLPEAIRAAAARLAEAGHAAPPELDADAYRFPAAAGEAAV